MKLRNLIILSSVIGLLVNSEIALGKSSKKNIIKGYCGKQKCQTLLKQLSDRYPEYTQKYLKECPRNGIIGLTIYGDDQNKKVYFACWEAKKEKNGDVRYGSPLGSLPIPGNENKFLTPLPSDPPYAQYLQQKYGNQVKKAQFQCSTKGGNFNLLISEDKKSVKLQCYYQAGVILIDSDNDWTPDGDTRGAGIDEILGTFPINQDS